MNTVSSVCKQVPWLLSASFCISVAFHTILQPHSDLFGVALRLSTSSRSSAMCRVATEMLWHDFRFVWCKPFLRLKPAQSLLAEEEFIRSPAAEFAWPCQLERSPTTPSMLSSGANPQVGIDVCSHPRRKTP